MRLLIASAAACLVLAGCTTTPDQDAALAKNVTAACQALDTAHASFEAFAIAGLVSQNTIKKVDAAAAGVSVICSDPSSVTGYAAIIRVSTATAVIIAALKATTSTN